MRFIYKYILAGGDTMVRKEFLWSRFPLVVAGLLFFGVYLIQTYAADSLGPEIPRDAIGAATPEYQQEMLAKLSEGSSDGTVPTAFDPVICSA